MVCDNVQFVANHTPSIAPSNFSTTAMKNSGIQNVFEYNYRTNQRVILQKNDTGVPSGNLLLFDAEERNWQYLFMFSTYYDIDWLAIDTTKSWIAYCVNAFKVQWWFNYRGASQVTRIFNNLWQTNQTNWNFATSKLNQITNNN